MLYQRPAHYSFPALLAQVRVLVQLLNLCQCYRRLLLCRALSPCLQRRSSPLCRSNLWRLSPCSPVPSPPLCCRILWRRQRHRYFLSQQLPFPVSFRDRRSTAAGKAAPPLPDSVPGRLTSSSREVIRMVPPITVAVRAAAQAAAHSAVFLAGAGARADAAWFLQPAVSTSTLAH